MVPTAPLSGRSPVARPLSATADTRELSLLIIDDHALFVDGLTLLLERLGPEVKVDSAASCERAVELLASGCEPNLILLDLNLPGLHHTEAFVSLRKRLPESLIVAISADERPHMIGDIMRAGARGYIPKSTNADVMLSALHLVLSGGVYLPEAVLGDGKLRTPCNLTPREIDVLELIAGGHGNKAIAERLGLAESTVRVHVTSLLRRLNVSSRFEAVNSPLVAELLRNRDPSLSGKE